MNQEIWFCISAKNTILIKRALIACCQNLNQYKKIKITKLQKLIVDKFLNVEKNEGKKNLESLLF